jgi:hypothetical protein
LYKREKNMMKIMQMGLFYQENIKNQAS